MEGSYGITLSNGSLPLNNAEVLTTEIPGIVLVLSFFRASLVAHLVKNPPAMWETWVWSLSGEDPLEKGMATHSSILAWRIPWTEEPGRLQSMGSQKWVTFTHSSLVLTSRILKKLILPVLSLVLWRSGKSLISHLGSASLWWLLKYFVNYLAFSSYSSGTVSCLSSLQCPETEVKNQFYVCINPR